MPYATETLVSIGSIVEYEDMANRPRRFVVLSGTDNWGQFTLRSIGDGYEYITSDLRQSGWTFISA
jgi:hypothetical protein